MSRAWTVQNKNEPSIFSNFNQNSVRWFQHILQTISLGQIQPFFSKFQGQIIFHHSILPRNVKKWIKLIFFLKNRVWDDNHNLCLLIGWKMKNFGVISKFVRTSSFMGRLTSNLRSTRGKLLDGATYVQFRNHQGLKMHQAPPNHQHP